MEPDIWEPVKQSLQLRYRPGGQQIGGTERLWAAAGQQGDGQPGWWRGVVSTLTPHQCGDQYGGREPADKTAWHYVARHQFMHSL
jgi:hypothetical protein